MKTEKQYMAESDANTLAQAEAIKKDRARMTQAKLAAKKMLKEQEDRAAGLKKVAGGTTRKKKKST